MRHLTKKHTVSFLAAMAVITLSTVSAFGDWLTTIPLLGTDTSQLGGYGITQDGAFVVGPTGTSGFLYNVANSTAKFVSNGTQIFSIADGVTYRNDNGVKEVVISGQSAGWRSEMMTTDGGTTFSAVRRLSSGVQTVGGSFNQVQAGGPSGQYYIATRDANNGGNVVTWQMSGPWVPSTIQSPKSPGASPVRFNGISGTGRAVGRRVPSGGSAQNYYLDYNGTSGGGGSYFNALNTVNTAQGEAWAVSANGLWVGGYSGVGTQTGILAPYLAKFSSGNFNVTPGSETSVGLLPAPSQYPDYFNASIYTSTTKGAVYGVSADGHYVSGFIYPGSNHAVVWDTGFSDNPANWTCIDLMAYAQAAGIMDGWTSLQKAYSVGEDPLTGAAIVTGFGTYGGVTRAFVMEIPEPTTFSLLALGAFGLLALRRRK